MTLPAASHPPRRTFSLTGFNSFSGVAAGSTRGGLLVQLDSSTAGTFAGVITLQPRSTNPQTFTMDLAPVSVHVIGEVRLAGDYNQNGVVDAVDYVLWRKGLGQLVTAFSGADGDGDGLIDDGDYEIWRAHFGNMAGSNSLASGTIPEPSTGLLLLAEIGAMIQQGRCGRGSIA